ncbi:hypothetical protein SARC_01096 [Sphaeroforma arctica JP610]|uniref:Uncharacterized protein n=1 Tax=Sphaeroforma arctica JP610 TaxID=667725 RepID=A0A0L0GCM1_9EUKA|nr:hypothetical protein SARC_01096 [Sphaeroforma arctica JP610]KNC86762.1 hypothetical protein SARC_01096 [Sphaeroforma arctica JP610]|eukprot:XP_014160664.1 hypothetical protein SARC_01096 [Sphaeroforma arctica JP610]
MYLTMTTGDVNEVPDRKSDGAIAANAAGATPTVSALNDTCKERESSGTAHAVATIDPTSDDKNPVDARNQSDISSDTTRAQPILVEMDNGDKPDNPDKAAYLVWKRTPKDATKCERLRDWLLYAIDATFLSTPAVVIWLILVVIVGAFFFLLAVGALKIGNEDNTKEWLNYSIQALNVLFTYTAIFTLVWRLSNAVHLLTERRSSERGLDMYGQPTMSIWFHLSHTRRLMITLTLLVNCVTQYLNQAMRLVYFSVEDSQSMPGVLLTNLFFVISFLAGAIAGVAQLAGESKLRHLHPHIYRWSGMTDPVDKLYRLYCSIVHSRDEGLNLSTTNLGRRRSAFAFNPFGKSAVPRRGTTGIIVEEPVDSGQPRNDTTSIVEKPADVGRSIRDLADVIAEEPVKSV